MHISDVANTAASSGGSIVGFIVGLAFYVLVVVALWRLFAKAGKPGWLAIIPIVNVVVLVIIAGYNGWLTLLYLIPIVNIVFAILVALRLGRAYGHGAVFAIFLLWLFPVIGYLIIGFSADQYNRAAVAPAA